jgi:sortase A
MKVLVAQESVRSILRRTQRVLLGCAIALLAWCGFVLIDSWIFQSREQRNFEQSLQESLEANRAAPQSSYSTAPKDLLSPLIDGVIGRVEVPRLGVSVLVIEGTSPTALRRAVGYISGTALPGRPGNVGISGHRDTFFRPLRNIRPNDIITITTLLGEYRYRVVSTRIVNPYDVWVLDQGGDEILTLVTCYPFYFVGSAPNRFIVRAERVG